MKDLGDHVGLLVFGVVVERFLGQKCEVGSKIEVYLQP
jgi:hypothetical protein